MKAEVRNQAIRFERTSRWRKPSQKKTQMNVKKDVEDSPRPIKCSYAPKAGISSAG